MNDATIARLTERVNELEMHVRAKDETLISYQKQMEELKVALMAAEELAEVRANANAELARKSKRLKQRVIELEQHQDFCV